ncbi:LPS export ABC transporter periplasmic protein LptC [Avibacterium sp. 21-586]|uniref:LPS export ABC transporter periplasmic protein LptC n=1 Tax=Avibacterium sp. 21-586 TaxID=2911534 RepID=UPI0022484978|nr:LPS export ABC transporter periplasmic protein LptC [Avibacterium sp. 21-586]MCW9711162.1 LPS export ABC transporter periplasmic protein LptC [Avibacterium sp. 21-586]
MNIRWNIILSVIALGLLTWLYSLQTSVPAREDLIKSEDSPEYIGNKMQTTVFSPTGEKQYFALADKVEHYDATGNTDFQQPLVYLYDVQDQNLGTQSWKISADKAQLTKDEHLYLEGNVSVQSLLPNSRLQRVDTERATVNLKTQDIHSDTMAIITGLNFTSRGAKLTGNLKQQIATLAEQVKTHYEISK